MYIYICVYSYYIYIYIPQSKELKQKGVEEAKKWSQEAHFHRRQLPVDGLAVWRGPTAPIAAEMEDLGKLRRGLSIKAPTLQYPYRSLIVTLIEPFKGNRSNSSK